MSLKIGYFIKIHDRKKFAIQYRTNNLLTLAQTAELRKGGKYVRSKKPY